MYIIANFKAYLDLDETNILVHQLLADTAFTESEHSIVLLPSMLAFTEVEKSIRDTNVGIGVQHVAWSEEGAYTGSVSADYVAKAGAQYTLVGHSERRHIFGETNEDTKKRFFAAMDDNLVPILCIGETKAEADAGERDTVLREQLAAVLAGVTVTKPFFVAYEPVWAIKGSGSGEACEPAHAESTHTFIKDELLKYSESTIPVLYGGSVNAENVVSYTSISSVDGVLVGSASTKPETFISLLSTT